MALTDTDVDRIIASMRASLKPAAEPKAASASAPESLPKTLQIDPSETRRRWVASPYGSKRLWLARRQWFLRFSRQLFYFIDMYNSGTCELAAHACTKDCRMREYGDFVYCARAGNIHCCATGQCDLERTEDSVCYCPVTGRSFGTERTAIDADLYNGIAGYVIEKGAEDLQHGGAGSGGGALFSNSYASVSDRKRYIALHPDIRRENEIASSIKAENTRAENRKRYMERRPLIKEEERAKRKRVRTQRVEGNVSVYRFRPQPTPVSHSSTETTACEAARKKPRITRAKAVVDGIQQRSTASTIAQRVLSLQVNAPMLFGIVGLCSHVWTAITATKSFQRASAVAYSYETHCHVVIDQMRRGVTLRGKRVIPRSAVVAAVVPTRVALSRRTPGIGTLTEASKRFKEYISEIGPEQIDLLSKFVLASFSV